MTDNSRFPGLLVSKKWVEKLDKNRIPNISNLIDAQMSPPFDPDRTYSIPWLSGITGIATNVNASGGAVVTTMQQLLEDPAQGQGDPAHGGRRHDEPDHARERRRSEQRHRRKLEQGVRPGPEGGRLGSDPPLHGQRLRGRPGGATSPPPSPGRRRGHGPGEQGSPLEPARAGATSGRTTCSSHSRAACRRPPST